MKKLLLLTLCLVLTLSLSAQERKGNWYLSGNTQLAYNSTKSGDDTFSQQTEGVGFSSFRSGYFITNRLLLGTRTEYASRSNDPNQFGGARNSLVFQPFVRYYFLDAGAKPISFFGELGFGTIGFGEGYGFETDFHLGLGAERALAPGVLATANLNYDANADGINYTNLVIGLNVLSGQLAGIGRTASVEAGTFSAAGQLLNAAYGRNSSGGLTDADLRINVSPQVGYFLLDGLLVEAAVDFTYSDVSSERNLGFSPLTNFRLYDLRAGVQARYYVLQRGRLLPFVSAGIGYTRLQQETEQQGSSQVEIYRPFWKLGAGASYFLSPQLAIDLTASYDRGAMRFRSGGRQLGVDLPERGLNVAASLRFFLPGQ